MKPLSLSFLPCKDRCWPSFISSLLSWNILNRSLKMPRSFSFSRCQIFGKDSVTLAERAIQTILSTEAPTDQSNLHPDDLQGLLPGLQGLQTSCCSALRLQAHHLLPTCRARAAKGTLCAQWPGNYRPCWPDGHHLGTLPWLQFAGGAKLNQNTMEQWFFFYFIFFSKYGQRIQPFWRKLIHWQNAKELS